MAKEDVAELPPVPKKRRHLENALDIHLARWLSSSDLSPSQRKKLEGEKQRRKSLKPDKRAVILVGQEGITPQQLCTFVELFQKSKPTHVVHTRLPRKTHAFLLQLRYDLKFDLVLDEREQKEIIRDCDIAIAAPNAENVPNRKTSGVWGNVAYSHHRGLQVFVVLPSGKIYIQELE